MSINIYRINYPEIEEVNSFIISCEETSEAMLVDAGGFGEEAKNFIARNDLKLSQLFITHNHHDHTSALSKVIAEHRGIRVFSVKTLDSTNESVVSEGQSITIGNLPGTVHLIPGHTDDGAALHVDGHLFTGDSLFAGSVGGTTDERSYHRQLKAIRDRLLPYPGDTIIHPGHGPDSTLELEIMYNPFLRMP